MDDNESAALIERLGGLGHQPIEPAVQARHLQAMAAVRRPARALTGFRLRVAAATVLVVLAVSTGLAAAQVDGGPVTAVGKGLMAAVGVDVHDGTVTHGTDRYYGEDCLQIADGKGARNHGQYLKWIRQNHPEMLDAAKKSQCGKPVPSEGHDDDKNEDQDEDQNDGQS